MTRTADDHERIVEYLLDSLPDEEREGFDELSVTDTAFANTLAAAEHDLVDAYVYGELTGDTLERFRSVYLSSPIKREKVELAQAIRAFSESHAVAPRAGQRALRSGVSPRALQWVLVAAASALLIFGGWLAMQNARLRQQVGDMRARNTNELQTQLNAERAAVAERDRELTQLRDVRDRLQQELQRISIVSFVLAPPLRTARQTPEVRIPAGTSHVAVQLELEPDDYDSYRVTLLGAANQTLWASEARSPRKMADGEALDVSIQSSMLSPGKYILRVTGLSRTSAEDVIADYPFTAVVDR